MFSIVKPVAAVFMVIMVGLCSNNLTWFQSGLIGMLFLIFCELAALHETVKSGIPKEIVAKVQDTNTTGDAWS